MIHRRGLLRSAAAVGALEMSASGSGALADPRAPHPMARVIIDNDFAGDPDGLFQLAHHVLCPSVRIPLIVGSHLPAQFGGPKSASDGAAKAAELLKMMGREPATPPIAGAQGPIPSRAAWTASPATAAIVREAMRADRPEPLVYAAGGGLTELALAWLAEPKIGSRIKLVWIGGMDHPGFANPPPGRPEMEFNLGLDPLAAQIVFNESDIEIWQVPVGGYRQMLFSYAEMDELASQSRLGAFLRDELKRVAAKIEAMPGIPSLPDTEVYILGDSALVTLTALMPIFNPDPSSSEYRQVPTPHLNGDGSYTADPAGRPMRVYTRPDADLTFRDMKAKFSRLARQA